MRSYESQYLWPSTTLDQNLTHHHEQDSLHYSIFPFLLLHFNINLEGAPTCHTCSTEFSFYRTSFSNFYFKIGHCFFYLRILLIMIILILTICWFTGPSPFPFAFSFFVPSTFTFIHEIVLSLQSLFFILFIISHFPWSFKSRKYSD